MRKLIVFNNVSLDGYFVDGHGDMSWAKPDHKDAEWSKFVEANATGEGPLVFGRITYELMASYWPTPMARQNDQVLADRMNAIPKIVFSKTLKNLSWKNTKLVKGDLVSEIRKLKKEPGEGMAILGSGSIVSQLAQKGLIDEYQVVVTPIALGEGRTMFEGLEENLKLKLKDSRTFKNGKVFLRYEPA